jgi:hypothetical protein
MGNVETMFDRVDKVFDKKIEKNSMLCEGTVVSLSINDEDTTLEFCPSCGKRLKYRADTVGIFAICNVCNYYEQL